MTGETDLTRARELLPWYVTGTLAERERALVDRQLAQSDELRAELAWLRKLQQDIRAAVPAATGDLGWSRFKQRMEAEKSGVLVPIQKAPRARWYAPALALAASILIAQTVVIGVLLDQSTPNVRPMSGPPVAEGPLLQIQFQPAATEQQIRELLSAAHAQIVSGPGALGVYTLRISDGDGTVAVQRLREATTVVESVSLLPR
jgi:hypothetical protein